MADPNNPYAPPAITAQAGAPAAMDLELHARRLEHTRVEQQIITMGSLLFATGVGQATVVIDWLIDGDPADTVLMSLIALSSGFRLCAGVGLWRLHPVGRWLHLGAWLALVANHAAYHVLYAENTKAVVMTVCAGLLGLAILWRASARPVFEPDYRNVVVPATPGVSRWGVWIWLAHLMIVLLVGFSAYRNLEPSM